MRRQAHLHDHGDPEIEPLAIEHGHPATDDTLLLELRDAPPTGRWRKAHGFGDLRRGARGIRLQQVEDAEVDAVHMCCRWQICGISVPETTEQCNKILRSGLFWGYFARILRPE